MRLSLVFPAAALAYAALVAGVRLVLERPPFVLWDVFLPLFAVVGACVWVVVALWRRNASGWADAAITLAIAALLAVTFAGGRTIIPVFWADVWLLAVERWIHGGIAPLDRLAPYFAARPRLAHWVWFNYHAYYLLLTIAVPAVVAVLPGSAARTRYLWASLLNVILLAHFGAAAFGSAGPVYWDGGVHGINRGVADQLNAMGLNALTAGQAAYWQSHGTLLGVTAFPSMHLAITTHWVLMARAWRPWTLAVMLPYLAFMLLGSVLTGWHYAIDGYAGIAGACLTWWLAGVITSRSRTPGPRLT
jgi:hypothetical protein